MNIDSSWNNILNEEVAKPYYQSLREFLRTEYANNICYPSKDNIFRAFREVPSFAETKVVILGQDPYYNPGLANGLAFSINEGCPIPTSLSNIFKEIQREYGKTICCAGDLSSWAKQGVLLLNTTLSVKQGQAGSHMGKGWETFTDDILELLGNRTDPMVYMLWGKYAKRKKYLIKNPNALILETSHPSGRSAHLGFDGCDHFLVCNKYLLDHGVQPINWYSIDQAGQQAVQRREKQIQELSKEEQDAKIMQMIQGRVSQVVIQY